MICEIILPIGVVIGAALGFALSVISVIKEDRP